MGTNYYAHVPVERSQAHLEFRALALDAAVEVDKRRHKLAQILKGGGVNWEPSPLEQTTLNRVADALSEDGYPPPAEVLHIGKSSAGWVFALHIIPDRGLNDLEDWELLLSRPDVQITDEYAKELSLDELLKEIRERGRAGNKLPSNAAGYADWATFHGANQSQEGPGGLVRSRVDGKRCVKHGEGTWDCHVGEFS